MQQNELPEGWIVTEVSNIGDIITGKTPPKEDKTLFGGEIPFFKPSDLNKGYFVESSQDSLTKKGLEYVRMLPPLTVMVTCIGATIGKAGLSRVEGTTNQQINSIVTRQDKISPKWLYHVFTSEWMQSEIQQRSSVTTLPIINKSRFSKLPIPIPPLPEQHRIVAAIEALFARLDATNERLDRVPGIMKTFRQAVLAAACDGRLTEDWRKENPSVKNSDDYLREVIDFRIKCSKKDELKFENISELDLCDLSELPDSWLWVPSNVIFSYVTSGSRGWAKYYSDAGSIFLRIGNLDRNSIYLQLKDIQRVTPPDNAEGKRTRIQKDDILVSITADIGSIGYICEELGDAYINQHIALARPVQNLNPKYIAYFLHSQTGGKKQFEKLHRGATKIGLGLDDIRSIAVPLPPLPEQQEIVRRVDALFDFADSIEAKVAVAREKTERLRQSILSKAFSGELVPTEAELARQEGREYESAEKLLERIKREGKSSKK
ncbi:MAG: restriction endonuclease subunit S [Methanomethylovorans sp.]|uniref:restriction endonuclease subunit S n=1 Tax=Methanomethylovorans sp. TaxID=2758717 RepID=UPI003530A433